MSSDTFQTISAERRRAMLRTAMGPAIAAALGDPRIIEIMVNPDGALRVDVLGEGRVETDVTIRPYRSNGSSAWLPPMREPRSMATRRSSRPNCRRMRKGQGRGAF
jgi:hypothetical protein